jgi:general secretion pathway protein A
MRDLVLDHFKLKRHPFSVEIETEGFYPFHCFHQGMLRLEQATHTRGPVLVLAEPGAGKTALIRAYCKRLASSSFEVHHQLVGPSKNPIRPLLEGFLRCFGEQIPFNNPARCLERLKECLEKIYAQGRLPVLLIDDAHHLNTLNWLVLKALMNYELDSKLPCLLIFMGKPDTLRILSLNEVQEVRERLSTCYHLRPLKRGEVKPYLEKRLSWAGLQNPIFPDSIAEQIWKQAQGNPRRINRLAEKCLLDAASEKKDLIDGVCLQNAISETQFHLPREEEAY